MRVILDESQSRMKQHLRKTARINETFERDLYGD